MARQITLDTSAQSIAVSQCGKYLAINHGLAANTYKVTLWSLPDGEFIREILSSNQYDFTSICFTGNGKILSISNIGGFVLFDIERRQQGTVAWAGDVYWMKADRGNRLVTAGKYIEVWEILNSENYEQIWKLPEYSNAYNSLISGAKTEISPDGKKLAVAGIGSEQVFIYNIEQNSVIQTLDGAPPEVYWISWSDDLKYIAIIGANYQGVYIWNLETGERVFPDFYNSEIDSRFSFCFHPNGQYFATGSFAGYVTIERISDGETVYFEPIHHGQVWALAFTPDGKQLISGGYDRFISILDLEDLN